MGKWKFRIGKNVRRKKKKIFKGKAKKRKTTITKEKESTKERMKRMPLNMYDLVDKSRNK